MITIKRTPDENSTRIALVLDGKSVSHLSVVDLRMHVGSAVVRCGGIAGLGTDRNHRNKGYARQVLDDSLIFMKEEGYHLSALFGIPDFYHKFGYAPGILECEAQLTTRHAERAEQRYTTRDYMPGDAGAIACIFEAEFGEHTGCVARDPESWRGFRRGTRWSDRCGAFVVLDGDSVIGYACYDLDSRRCSLAEVACREAAAYATIVSKAAELAWERRLGHITVHTAPDDPFLAYCRRYGLEMKTTYTCCGAGMVRVINQDALLNALHSLFSRRVGEAMGGWDGSLTFTTDLGATTITFGSGGSDVGIALPQWMLAQLVLGYRSVDDALLGDETRADREALPLLRVLFPVGHPYIHWSDRF